MAQRSYNEIQSPNMDEVDINGSFAPAGAGAVTDVFGKGFSVARTGVGTFTVTLLNAYNKLLSATATLQLAASADSVVQVGSYVSASRTVILRTLTAGADAEIAADANNRVHFSFKMSNTAVAGG